jgi:hypothetical protein
MKSYIFRGITPCGPMKLSGRFRGASALSLGPKRVLANRAAQKVEHSISIPAASDVFSFARLLHFHYLVK